jgi:plasmid stabilization system protein ParE
MTYRVIVTPAAENDLRTAYRYIRRQAPRAARDWIRRARQTAKSLAHHPERCPMAPKAHPSISPSANCSSGNRGIYRFLFVVFAEEKSVEKSVYILHVRHGSMLPLSSGR